LKRRGINIGNETAISPQARFPLSNNLCIGEDCVISSVSFDGWAKINIGNHVILSPGVKIITGNHNLHSPDFEGKLLPITIEDYSWIATSAMILGGVTIGRGAVVGAGCVVRQDVPPGGIVIGNPSQLVGYRRCSNFSYNPGKQSYKFS